MLAAATLLGGLMDFDAARFRDELDPGPAWLQQHRSTRTAGEREARRHRGP